VSAQKNFHYGIKINVYMKFNNSYMTKATTK